MVLACPLAVIGVVHTDRVSTENTPVQAALNRVESGTIEILPPYDEGLSGLEGFDYAWLLSWLHDPAGPAAPPPMKQVPFLLRPQQREVGIFATRGPRRVNPIGLSLIELQEISGPEIRFAGVDLIDGTPVIDLKPYVSRFDRPEAEPRCGWFDEITFTPGATPADLGRN